MQVYFNKRTGLRGFVNCDTTTLRGDIEGGSIVEQLRIECGSIMAVVIMKPKDLLSP
jgi:hypothetical protein